MKVFNFNAPFATNQSNKKLLKLLAITFFINIVFMNGFKRVKLVQLTVEKLKKSH
jgi:hypothetical protein